MKVYFYKELRKMDIDKLLDLLSVYIFLKKDILKLIKIDKDNKDYYIKENLYYYQLNITKIKNELEAKVELITETII